MAYTKRFATALLVATCLNVQAKAQEIGGPLGHTIWGYPPSRADRIDPGDYHAREIEKALELLRKLGGDPRKKYSLAWLAERIAADIAAGRLSVNPDLEADTLGLSSGGEAIELNEIMFLPESMAGGRGFDPETEYGFDGLIWLISVIAHEIYHVDEHELIERAACNIGGIFSDNPMEEAAWLYQIHMIDLFFKSYSRGICGPLMQGSTGVVQPGTDFSKQIECMDRLLTILSVKSQAINSYHENEYGPRVPPEKLLEIQGLKRQARALRQHFDDAQKDVPAGPPEAEEGGNTETGGLFEEELRRGEEQYAVFEAALVEFEEKADAWTDAQISAMHQAVGEACQSSTSVAIRIPEECVATEYVFIERVDEVAYGLVPDGGGEDGAPEEITDGGMTPQPSPAPETDGGLAPPEDDDPPRPVVVGPPPEDEPPAESVPEDEPPVEGVPEDVPVTVVTTQVPLPRPRPQETPEMEIDLGLVKAEEAVVTVALTGRDSGEAIEGASVKLLLAALPLPGLADDGSLRTADAYEEDVPAGVSDGSGTVSIAFGLIDDQQSSLQKTEIALTETEEIFEVSPEGEDTDVVDEEEVGAETNAAEQSQPSEPQEELQLALAEAKATEPEPEVPSVASTLARLGQSAEAAPAGEAEAASATGRGPMVVSEMRLEEEPRAQLVVALDGQTDTGPMTSSPVPGGSVTRTFHIGTTPVMVVSVPQSRLEETMRTVRESRDVTFVEEDPCRNKEVGDDPHFGGAGLWGQAFDNQWAVKRVGFTDGAESPWEDETEPGPVTVAVIDTGLDWYHPDLAPTSIWRNSAEVPDNDRDDDGNGYVDDVIGWNFVQNDNLPWDHDGHGTFVSGVIAAARNNGIGIAGINPAARIMVLKALDAFGQGHASMVSEAIAYAADHGAQVINLSLGGRGLTQIEQLAIEHARSRGAVIVVAAGNAGSEVAAYSPGGLEGALTVTATDRRDRRAGFSNWGPMVDIAAPGVDILSLRARNSDLLALIPNVRYELGAGIVGPDRAYYRASGTSFAAPIVSGTISLILSRNPGLEVASAERMILQSAKDIETAGHDNYTGYGLLDAAAALKAPPDYFVDSRISGIEVVQVGNSAALRVLGTADADQFAEASLMVGKGKDPDEWLRLKMRVTEPVKAGTLLDIPAAAFQGSHEWTIRLVTLHSDGSSREARFSLNLQ